MNVQLSVALALLSFWMAPSSYSENRKWPAILPVHESYAFSDSNQAVVDVKIVGTDQQPLYRLECHNYAYESDQEFDYSGDFECKLTSLYSHESFRTLLTDNPDKPRDWESRGRFLTQDVVGSCASYPDYGTERLFELRGMRLFLKISDIVFKEDRGRKTFASFHFSISATADPNARTRIAAPSHYEEPSFESKGFDSPRDCRVVRKRSATAK